MPDRDHTRTAYIAWLVVSIVWGTTYLAIKLALDGGVPPFLIGGIRYTLAGWLLAGLLLLRGRRLPGPATWPHFLLLGTLMFGLGNGGVIWAELWVASGFAALIVATLPFWMVGLEAWLPGGERLTRRRSVGLLLGFVGIVLLVAGDLVTPSGFGWRTLAGLVALQIACAGWAYGSSYGRRKMAGIDPIASAAMQMIGGGLVMIAVATVAGEWPRFAPTGAAIGAIVYLWLAGSLLAFAAYTYALEHLPVSFVSLYAYVNPIVAVALGTWLLGEPFNARMAVAIVVILAGMWMVSGQRNGQAASHEPDAPGRRVGRTRRVDVAVE